MKWKSTGTPVSLTDKEKDLLVKALGVFFVENVVGHEGVITKESTVNFEISFDYDAKGDGYNISMTDVKKQFGWGYTKNISNYLYCGVSDSAMVQLMLSLKERVPRILISGKFRVDSTLVSVKAEM